MKDYIRSVEALAKIMKEQDLQYISVDAESVKINIAAKQSVSPINYAGRGAKPDNSALSGRSSVVVEEINGNLVKSPIVGTFYEAPSPDSKPFVKIGDIVKKGQVICIIESMKLMNEVLSEFDGTVGEIFAKNGEAVEFDQKLMLIR
ncbi:MAG: acetyl-CoA carboxylase biotin carboxyl carrier protein [Eubacterium sp.]|nr:acetyl-CoA carboxylase biotin carboxyl carrier protein [Eubacterium sp.]